MKSYSLDELQTALGQLGISSGETLFMHSSIFGLGRLRDFPSAEAPGRLLGGLQARLGAAGTLCAPVFDLQGFSEGKPFDRQRSPSVGMGVLSEALRLLPEAQRNHHPIQSVAVVGPRAAVLCAPDPASGYDEQGTFGLLLAQNARILLVGLDCTWVSFIHYVEERENVPYRHWKSFTGSYTDHGVLREATYRMFVRRRAPDPEPELDLRVVGEILEKHDALTHAPLGAGRLSSCRFRDFFEIVGRELSRDPYWLVGNKTAFPG